MLCRLCFLISIMFTVCSQAHSNSGWRTLFNFFPISVITFPFTISFSVTTETLHCNIISFLPEQIFRKADPVSTTEATLANKWVGCWKPLHCEGPNVLLNHVFSWILQEACVKALFLQQATGFPKEALNRRKRGKGGQQELCTELETRVMWQLSLMTRTCYRTFTSEHLYFW